MATVEDVKNNHSENASSFDHKSETLRHYYYEVLLEDSNISAGLINKFHYVKGIKICLII